MKNLWAILTVGIFLRVFLAFFTFHPDLQAFNLSGEIVASGNIINLYDYLPNLAENDPRKQLAVLNYPPAIYFFHGIFNFLYTDILRISFINDFLLDNPSNYGNIIFNLHLLFLKLPYLIFDILIAFLLTKIVKYEKEAKLAFILWMFNPFNLYATYMMGQFDIIPTFFTILSVYFIGKKKLSLAALALGGGIAFKLYPIFLLIPLLVLERSYKEKAKLFIISISPYLLSILPYIFSSNFRSIALFANQSSKSLYANVALSGGEVIMFFPLALIFFYLWLCKEKVFDFTLKLYLIPLLLFFIFTHFHPQWIIWISPFLILDLVLNRFENLLAVLLLFTSWFGSLFFFDPSLTLGIFAPLIHSLHNIQPIWNIFHLKVDYNFSRSVLQTILAASSIYLIYYHLHKKNA